MTFAAIRNCSFGMLMLLLAGNAHAQPPGWAHVLFERNDFDFGVVAKNSEARYRIKLTNPGNDIVHIVGARTGCACAHARALTDTLGPGETGYIEVTFDTKKFEKLRETAVIVSFDRPMRADVQIPVKVYIRTDVHITPGEAAFGTMMKGTSAERRLNIAYAGRPGWSIKEVVNRSKHLQVQLHETSRLGGSVNYDLAVIVLPTVPPGDFREQLILVTDDVGDPQVPVLVEGRVEAEYYVVGDLIDFGTVGIGERRTKNLVVRGRQPFAIETIESERTAGVFEVRLPKEIKSTHVLPFTVIAPSEPGTLSEEFSITIKGGAEPVTFKAHCRVVPITAGR